jgi:hypothetical protein
MALTTYDLHIRMPVSRFYVMEHQDDHSASPHFVLHYEVACAHTKKELCHPLMGDDITGSKPLSKITRLISQS